LRLAAIKMTAGMLVVHTLGWRCLIKYSLYILYSGEIWKLH